MEVKALTSSEEITSMGRLLSKLPMDVHLGPCLPSLPSRLAADLVSWSRAGKFLLTAALFKCLDPALTIAATLNAKSPFVAPFGLEQEADRAKLSFKTGTLALNLPVMLYPDPDLTSGPAQTTRTS